MWIHKKTIFDSEKYEINGINIWDFKWDSIGKKITVKDPLYGQSYSFNIYKIKTANFEITFAAGEFSNCVWGIYQLES